MYVAVLTACSLIHANIVTTYMYELKPLGELERDSPQGVGLGSGMLEISVEGGRPAAYPTCWKLYIVQEYCEYGALKIAIDQGWLRTASNEACLVREDCERCMWTMTRACLQDLKSCFEASCCCAGV